MRSLWAIFAMQQKCSDGASEAGKDRECDQGHDESQDHDEGEAFRSVEYFHDLLHVGIGAAGGVLLNVVQKSVVNFFSRTNGGPQRENGGEDAESQCASERAQASSHASGEIRCRTAAAVEHDGEKAGGKHSQAGRHADDDQENSSQQRNSGGRQSVVPLQSGRHRGVRCVLFDSGFRSGSNRRERCGSGDANLRCVASGAEWSAVLDACAAFIAGMFHWISRYSRGVRRARNVGSGGIADGRGRPSLK